MPAIPAADPATTAPPRRATARSWQAGWVLVLLVWVVWAPRSAVAQKVAAPPVPVRLDSTVRSLPPALLSTAWVDASGALTVEQIEQQATTLPFARRDRAHRVSLGDAGDRIAMRDRPAPDRYPVFALDPRTDAPVGYWVRIKHARVPFSGELFIHSHGSLREQRILQQFLLGAHFGMALLPAVAVANGLVFRDRSFLAYAGYISLPGLSLAASLEVGGQFLWPASPRWNGLAEFVLLPLAAAAILFVRQVVQPRLIGPTLHRRSLSLAALLLALTVWDAIWPSQASFLAITVAGTATLAAIYAMLWSAWRTGDRWVRWIAVGILPVLLAGAMPALRNLNLISSGLLTQYAVVIAPAIEAPLRINGLLQRSSLQHEAQAHAKALALTEPLTGLCNRHNFMLCLLESLVRAQRYRHHDALLLVVLDNHDFSLREHGREVADRALVLTGSLLRSVARDVDIAARVNDNHFALLMEGPVRGPQAVATATSVLAGGLGPSDELPVGSTLKLKTVLALLPQDSVELPQNAQVHLDWLQLALEEQRHEPRRSIQSVNC